jgi:hypothetical protein
MLLEDSVCCGASSFGAGRVAKAYGCTPGLPCYTLVKSGGRLAQTWLRGTLDWLTALVYELAFEAASPPVLLLHLCLGVLFLDLT